MDEVMIAQNDGNYWKNARKKANKFMIIAVICLVLVPICVVFRKIEGVETMGGACIFLIMLTLPISIINYIVSSYSKSNTMIVTDKRVHGAVKGGIRVDLPFDSITSVATTRLFHGITVATSSGRISFWGIGNRDELHKAISELLIQRQAIQKSNTEKTTATYVTHELSNADELRKFKALWDDGIISEDEYNQKKKQLLGL